jgi:hypothetical protein
MNSMMLLLMLMLPCSFLQRLRRPIGCWRSCLQRKKHLGAFQGHQHAAQ